MTKNNGGITSWLKQNAWAIIIFAGVTIAGYATLNAKVSAMDKKLAEYPSQDYFSLKFQNMDDRFTDLQKQISELKIEVRAIK